MSVAASTAIGLGVAAGTAGAGIVSAEMSSGAAKDAAGLQTTAANHAADVQAESTRQALAFERQQAQAEAAAKEVDRHANFDQYAAHERGVSTIGELLGLGGKEIPGYVPGVVPDFGAAPPSRPPVPVGAGQTPAAAVRRPGVMVPTVADAMRPPGAPGVPLPSADDLAQLRARMGGNTGVFNPYAPKLQPDGTFAIPSSPVLSIDDYLRA